MGSLTKSSWVVIPTILGEFLYMQISAAIIETSMLFNIVKSMEDTVTKMVSVPIFSRSMIGINTIRNYKHVCLVRICKLATAIIAKPDFFDISDGNKIKVVSTIAFS